MTKSTKVVACFCQHKCMGGIPSSYSFVKVSTRKFHERQDPTALARRIAYNSTSGVPFKHSVVPDNVDNVQASAPSQQSEVKVSKILTLDNNIEEEIEAENININQQNEQVEDDQEALDEEDTKNPSLFPSEPVAYIFVMLLLMLQGKYLTLEGCEWL
ncbi:hypothetical protein BD770DRAFT_417143 [Pilaira anomala]|nr:hypothetical protein BD770DRAFT_417143 [Pilaira anomala]